MKNRKLCILSTCFALAFATIQCSIFPSFLQPQPLPQDYVPPENQNPPAQSQLEGIWEAQTQTEYGMVYSELILEYTNTFSQQVVFGDLITYDVGTYQVGDGFIHFVVEDHEPKIYNGKEMTWLNSFTYFYTFVDANTINFEDRISGTWWTAYRK